MKKEYTIRMNNEILAGLLTLGALAAFLGLGYVNWYVIIPETVDQVDRVFGTLGLYVAEFLILGALVCLYEQLIETLEDRERRNNRLKEVA